LYGDVAVAWRLERSRKDLERATRDNERLREENERLRREREQLQREIEELEHERDRYNRERGDLEKELEAARRAAKRQSGAFLEGRPTLTPRRPGRRPGHAYGPHAGRAVPEHVDAGVEALRPGRVPCAAAPWASKRCGCSTRPISRQCGRT